VALTPNGGSYLGFNEIELYTPSGGVSSLDGSNEGCYRLLDRESCVASRDGRGPYIDQPCTWCCGAACTDHNDSAPACQPCAHARLRSARPGRTPRLATATILPLAVLLFRRSTGLCSRAH
jgi:hypothetical protein